ncbi:hypothetical protein T484DRAFT_3104185 [Baffinella frigidus]|nr:hypothetical protein T484DRAFT_3104185 [Cryptophyta sp. CCMP2293]
MGRFRRGYLRRGDRCDARGQLAAAHRQPLRAHHLKETGGYLVEADRMARLNPHGEESIEMMQIQLRRTWIVGGVMSVVLIIVWPLLTLPANPFTESYFTFWVALAFIWAHFAAFTTIVGPVLEYMEVYPFYNPTPDYEPSAKSNVSAAPAPANADGFYMPQPMMSMPMQQSMPMPMQMSSSMPMQQVPLTPQTPTPQTPNPQPP